MSTSRNWTFTRQTTKDEAQAIENHLSGAACAAMKEPFQWYKDVRVRYIVYQLERAPDTRKLHYQGLVCMKSSCRMSAVKTLITYDPHVEVCKSVKGSIDYCKKAESRVEGPWEHGEPPANQGKRSDLIKVYEDVKSGKSMAAMLEEDPTVAKWDKHIKVMKFAIMEKESDRQANKPEVYVLWGDADTGKTYTAINRLTVGKYYVLNGPSSRGGKLWYDGYEGQNTLILDDFSGKDFCYLDILKRILDEYKYSVEIKGGHTWACWHRIIITSNIQPRYWYPDWQGQPINDADPHKRALSRRIHHIYRMTSRGHYIEEDFDGNTLSEEKEFTDTTLPVTTTTTSSSAEPMDNSIDTAVDTEPDDDIHPDPAEDTEEDEDLIAMG